MDVTDPCPRPVSNGALEKASMKVRNNITMSSKIWLNKILCIIQKGHYPGREEKIKNDMEMDIAKYIMLMQYTRYLSEKAEVELHMPVKEVAGVVLTNHLSGLPVVNNKKKGVNGIASEFDALGVLRHVIDDEIISYEEDINDSPDDAQAHFKLGFFHLLLRNKRSALKEYKILKDLFPSMADTLIRKWNIKTPF